MTKNTNKILSSGLFERVTVNNMVLSTKSPDNYIKIEDEIGRIQDIYKKNNGEIILKVKFIVNLSDTFDNPLESSDVNMFECAKEKYSKSVFVNVSHDDVVKVAKFELRNRTHYIALLH